VKWSLTGEFFVNGGGWLWWRVSFLSCICLQIADNNNICDLKCWRHKVLLCHIFGYKVGGKGSKFGYIKSFENFKIIKSSAEIKILNLITYLTICCQNDKGTTINLQYSSTIYVIVKKIPQKCIHDKITMHVRF